MEITNVSSTLNKNEEIKKFANLAKIHCCTGP